MTGNELLLLTHYHITSKDHLGIFQSSLGLSDAIRSLVVKELLNQTATGLQLTERGRVHIEALRSVNLPQLKWVSPVKDYQ